MRLSLLILPALLITGCAHQTPRSDYPSTANGAEEIQKLDADLNRLSQEGTDLLSPEHFQGAKDRLTDAKHAQEKGRSNEEILNELSYARGHYELAVKTGQQGREEIPEALTARNNAIRAGGPKLFPSEFKDAEDDLEKIATNIENGRQISAKDRNELRQKYMNLELKAIKKNRLGKVEAKLDRARDMKARKYAPRTLDDAEATYANAEAVIAANRTNDSLISAAVWDADEKADRLTEVTQVVADSNGKTTESAAISIVEQRQEIARQSEDIRTKEEALRTSQSARAREAGALEAVKEENRNLEAEARLNRALTDAQKRFDPSEADVYRKNNHLIIRLKKIDFASGKATLPKKAESTLEKVTEVIGALEADKVTVEGHTDSTGSKIVNERLSQKRADAVKEYLLSEKAINEDAIDSKGFGFDKPIAPNRTKEGRAQNRRVDIVITPNQG